MYQFCDACKDRINGKITVIHVDSGELIRLSSGREHLRSDLRSRMHVLCSVCGARATELLMLAVKNPPAVSRAS